MTDYSTTLAAIDQAITEGVDRPGQIRSADGRTITYRSLDELLAVRKQYARLLAAAKGGFVLRKIRSGSARL